MASFSSAAGKLTYALGPGIAPHPNVPNVTRFSMKTSVLPPGHLRVPAKLSTVCLVRRKDYFRKPPKVVVSRESREDYATLEECMQSRPPLRLDMSGPKPTSYDPPRNLPWVTTSPSYTMRPKTQPEKDRGGDRVSWSKQWISSPDIWTYRANFDSRHTWPSPAHYTARPTFGYPQCSLPQSPSHSMGKRAKFSIVKKGAEDEPAPNQYNYSTAQMNLMKHFPAHTIQQGRRGGTMMWTQKEPVPGPGTYNPRVYRTSSKRCAPAFSIPRSVREIGIIRNCSL